MPRLRGQGKGALWIMLRPLRYLASAAFACGIALAAESIPVDQLPQAVIEAIRGRHPDATLVSAERDERNDFVYFFVDLEAAGKAVRVEIDEYGRFVESP